MRSPDGYDFQACKVNGLGSFIVTAHGAVTTLAAMNYEVLLAAKNSDSADNVQQLLRFAWYFVLGRADLFDRAIESFDGAVDIT